MSIYKFNNGYTYPELKSTTKILKFNKLLRTDIMKNYEYTK